jgi:hypothetical protein
MTAEAVIFEELTGSRRSIELRNRALPYRPVAFPGEQRIKKTTYPGNPVATIQVLGPNEQPIELKGTWKTRYVTNDARLSGFDDIYVLGFPVTAEILSTAFERLRVGGNQISLTWGPIVRIGVITQFVPNFQRVEDIEWTLTFEPQQRGTRVAPVASSPTLPTVDVNIALVGLLDAFLDIPFFIPSVTGPLLAAEIAAQTFALNLTSSLAAISGIPEISKAQFKAVASAASSLNDACQEIRALCLDKSIEVLIPTAKVSDILAAENWRRAAAIAAAVLATAGIDAREAVRSRVGDDVIETVTLKDNQTLRDIALAAFGSADDWVVIADFNGITTSDPGSGTTIRVPRKGFNNSGSGLAR